MSEVLEQTISPEERVSRMRDCLSHAIENDYSNVEVLGAFIDLYEEHSKTLDIGTELNPFFESLDFPEHDFEFGEPTFEDIVTQYDALGGQRDRSKIHLNPDFVEAPDNSASRFKESERDLDLRMRYDHVQATSFKFPVLVHDKLRSLVDGANEEAIKTTQVEVVSALIAFNDLDEESLAKLIMRYRKTTRGDYLEQNPDLKD